MSQALHILPSNPDLEKMRKNLSLYICVYILYICIIYKNGYLVIHTGTFWCWPDSSISLWVVVEWVIIWSKLILWNNFRWHTTTFISQISKQRTDRNSSTSTTQRSFIHKCEFICKNWWHVYTCSAWFVYPAAYPSCTVRLGQYQTIFSIMTSSNGNIFRVIGHLCGEFTGHRWIPQKKTSDAELWCFLWSASE